MRNLLRFTLVLIGAMTTVLADSSADLNQQLRWMLAKTVSMEKSGVLEFKDGRLLVGKRIVKVCCF